MDASILTDVVGVIKPHDSGRRFGIKVRYSTKQGLFEYWYKLDGEENAAKLNSLVDVLEGRKREWKAQQPR